MKRKGARNRRYLWLGIVAAIALSLFAGRREAGRAEDAAVRQQVRVPGGRRYAGRHAAGADRRGAARDGRLSGDHTGSDRLPGLRRNGVTHQFQRPGAPVLPAAGAGERRHPGQPGGQASSRPARATRSPLPCGPSSSASAPGSTPRSRWSKCRPGRRCSRPLVAEVYGPDEAGRHAVAKRVRAEFAQASRHRRRRRLASKTARRSCSVRIDQARAASLGVAPADIVAAMRVAPRWRGRDDAARRASQIWRAGAAHAAAGTAGAARRTAGHESARQRRRAGAAVELVQARYAASATRRSTTRTCCPWRT